MKSFFKEFNKHQSKLTRMYSFRSLLSCKSFPRPQQLGPWFNIKMSSYQYSQSHCGDKTILRPSYLCNGISYTDQGTPGNANLIGRFENLQALGVQAVLCLGIDHHVWQRIHLPISWSLLRIWTFHNIFALVVVIYGRFAAAAASTWPLMHAITTWFPCMSSDNEVSRTTFRLITWSPKAAECISGFLVCFWQRISALRLSRRLRVLPTCPEWLRLSPGLPSPAEARLWQLTQGSRYDNHHARSLETSRWIGNKNCQILRRTPWAAHTVNSVICKNLAKIEWMLLNFTPVIQLNCHQPRRNFEKSFCAVDRLSCQNPKPSSQNRKFCQKLSLGSVAPRQVMTLVFQVSFVYQTQSYAIHFVVYCVKSVMLS